MNLVEEVLAGNRLALARLLTQIENETAEGLSALEALYPHTGRAHLIGVTGAPGTGKSTLVNTLALKFRRPESGEPKKVGIVAVDPSSPFSGGAILGDRVRMRDLAGDPGVFIRSMASRGSLGGLAVSTSAVVQAFDAAGYDVIFIETVGAGQAEVDIARLAHTTIVIEAPGLGDDIQAIKAGILEIADILVVNKADRPGVEITERALKSMLQLAHPHRREMQNHLKMTASIPFSRRAGDSRDVWTPPVIRTISTQGEGIEELYQEIGKHYQYLQETGELFTREEMRIRAELSNLVMETLVTKWKSNVTHEELEGILHKLVRRELTPWQAVSILVDGRLS